MSELTKEVVQGSVEILENKDMQVRDDTVIYEDGVDISRTYFRYTVLRSDDTTNRPKFVQDLAKFLRDYQP